MNRTVKITIKGQITAIRNRGKLISRNHIYGYMINFSKINTYGFLPHIGQSILAKGIRAPSWDGIHDFTMSHFSKLEYIAPKAKKREKNIPKI